MMLFNALLSIYFHQGFSYIFIYTQYMLVIYVYTNSIYIYISSYPLIQLHSIPLLPSLLFNSPCGSTEVGNTPRCRPTSRNTPRAWPSSNKVPSYCCRRAQGLGGSFGRCPPMPVDVRCLFFLVRV